MPFSLPHANPMEQSPNQLPQMLPILKYTRQREIEILSGVIYVHTSTYFCQLNVIAGCYSEKSSWCRNEQLCQGGGSVKRFERSDGLDTALYKNRPLPFYLTKRCVISGRD